MSDAVPDDWAALPPGPQLGARLALIDPHTAEDEELPALLAAQYRQLAYQQSQLWAVAAEMAVRAPSVGLPGNRWWTGQRIFDNAVDEVRAELVLTRRSAGSEVAHACAVAAQPRIAGALATGLIDRQKAIVLADGCADLSGVQTDKLLDEVLPTARTVTATGLADRVRRTAIALDPAWARRRYTDAVRERKVVGYLNSDGSATLAGQNLPAEDAAAAGARVDALADAAKRAGAAARIDHLRAEVFLGLLDGRWTGRDTTSIVTDLLRQYPKVLESADQTDERPAAPRAAVAKAAPEPSRVATGTDASAADAEVAERDGVAVHLRVGLATLLGLDERPGEIAGWGIVPADVALRVAARQHAAEWRYAILDDHGRLLSDGITRHRPGSLTVRRRGRRRRTTAAGIVELHVPLALLADPRSVDAHPEWARVLADLARQYARREPIVQDPTARFPGRRLRRRSQTLFQRCVFPGCRRPATDCDIDHRREYARGGATAEANLQPGCRHDHQLKTSRGWSLIRPDEHTYVWRTPFGREHIVAVDPVAAPLPEPIPRQLPPEFVPPEQKHAPASYQPHVRRRRAGGRPIADSPRAGAIEHGPDPPPF
jgi:hypothetical protein